MPATLSLYLFFAWFSIAPQLLYFITGTTGWVGPRDALIHSLTWLLLPAVLPRRTWSVVFGIVGTVMGLSALTKLGYFLIFQQEMSQSVFVAILESPPEETKEFLHQFFHWWMVPIGVLFCAPAWWLHRRIAKLPVITTTTRAVYAAVALVLTLSPFVMYQNSAQHWDHFRRNFATTEPWGIVQDYLSYKENLGEADRLESNMESISKDAVVKNTDTTAEQTYVLVLGESTTRNRMSLYGYAQDTSPRLEEIRKELLVYDNVVANIPYTIESLSSTLTFTPPEKFNEAYRDMNVVTLMKKAGFKTFWITNQQTLTRRNTMLTAFAKLTDDAEFLNQNRRQSANSYDDVVVQPFTKALADPAPKKLIIVHLIGTHFSYEYRYPSEFAVFDSQTPQHTLVNNSEARDLYDQYDNAVRYNDHVVREIIDAYRAKNAYGFLMYFSDHGEEVFSAKDFNGRDMYNPTINMYDVPFIVWPSPRWAAQHDMQALADTVHRPSSLSLMMNGWCTLTGIQFNKCDAKNSLFSPQFVAQPRWVGIGKARHSYEALEKRDRPIIASQMQANHTASSTSQR
jgi:heptose-I-phosphate ethanolaminephosphotransferase